MGILETDRRVLEPFLSNRQYIEPRVLSAVRGYVCQVWDDSPALLATTDSGNKIHSVAFEDEGYFEDQMVKAAEYFALKHEDKTRALVIKLRSKRVPRFVTVDAIASASWVEPINRTPFESRIQRLSAIRDYIQATGEKTEGAA